MKIVKKRRFRTFSLALGNNLKTIKMKKLLLMPILLIFACGSDSDSNNNDDTTQLFLEKYDGVMWAKGDGTANEVENEFMTFSPNGASSGWSSSNGIYCNNICVWGEADEYGSISTIQEETENSLVIYVDCFDPSNGIALSGTDCEGDEYYTLTINVSADGNTMITHHSEISESPREWVRDNDLTTPLACECSLEGC